MTDRLLIVLSFLAIYLMWGSTYLAIAIAVKEIPPFMVVFLRLASAGALLVIGEIWR